ncbi:ATP-binding protein [Vibrio sp. TRT 17S01]|uniref:ATP-binding protein n=1 Tax=Vibrio sp. TRT 17S01 TaxID=3418505 RepID=UPI003CFA56E1
MSNSTEVNFVANAGVKDIVGRGLIYNDNVAIIELVKNSKDADSPRVVIELTDVNIDTSKDTLDSLLYKPEICIKDFGIGMTKDDIKNKWLNIAYSEKRDAKDKQYAGNKGVGRFSCDRLGEQLTLYTRSAGGEYLKLVIDWTLYENKEVDDEISTIPLLVDTLSEGEFLTEINEESFHSGTVLKIEKLRSVWDAKKLGKLLSELEKFSPSLDEGFEVYMQGNMHFDTSKIKSEEAKRKLEELNRKLKSKVDNGILDKLKIKTSYISSVIDDKGEYINTTLYFQGEEIYQYKAENPYKLLSSVSIEVHYLDSISKGYFTRRVGINPNAYGSVFLFYNGFRISPYGNEKNDWLNLDQRKTQGTSRYLGTRDVFGQVTVKDTKNSFGVITSREGLAHNKAYFELAASDEEDKVVVRTKTKDQPELKEYGFVTLILRQLEAFVVEGLEWNRLVDTLKERNVVSAPDAEKDPERFIFKELSREKIEGSLDKLVKGSLNVIDYKINSTLILQIEEINQKKREDYLREFVSSLGDTDFASLSQNDKQQTKKIIQELTTQKNIAIEQKVEAEKVASIATKKKIIATEKLKTEERRSSFLERLVDPEKTLDALITHVIQQISGGIEKDARSVLSAFYEAPDSVSKEELVEVLEHAVLDISTIKETANMATKANFNIKVSSVKQDLYLFFEDYIKKVVSKNGKWGVKINAVNTKRLSREINFKPAEACVLFVNILENSRRAGAKNLSVIFRETGIDFVDDGSGFDFERLDSSAYFKKGISTTVGGSGLGLSHCRDIAKSLGATLTIGNSEEAGAVVALEFSDEA